MPAPAKGRCIRDEADARQLLDQISQSDLGTADWCKQNDINKHSLYSWRAKLARQRLRQRKQAAQKEQTLPHFAEIQLHTQTTPQFLITAPNGWTLQIDGNPDAEPIGAILQAIAKC